MPKKSNKGYDPINLENLEQAIKLWKELNLMHSDVNKYVENYDKYMTKIDSLVGKQRNGKHRELSQLETELKRYKAIAQEQLNIERIKQRELAIDKEKERVEKERLAREKEQAKIDKANQTAMNRLNSFNRNATNRKNNTGSVPLTMENGNLNMNGLGNYLVSNSSAYNKEYNRVYNHVYANVLSREQKAAAKEGRAIDYNYVQSRTMENVNNSLEKSGFTKKMNTVAGIFQLSANTFSMAVNKIFQLFWAGSDRQLNAYNETFENVSLRGIGVTGSNYKQAQIGAKQYIDDNGLFDNVSVSEVQRMWDKLSSNGTVIDMSSETTRANLLASSIETVLTNKIVPYLDTSTAQWNQLISAQPELQKNIRGINQLNAEIVGNNYATEKLVQKILDDLQPISDNAMTDLAKSTAGATAFINSMMESGMDEATATALWTAHVKQQKYGAEILRSGSTYEQMALISALDKGINIYDSADTGKSLTNIAQTGNMMAHWGPGYYNTMSGIVQSDINGAVGLTPEFAMWSLSRNNANQDIINASNNAQNAINNYKNYGNKATENYKKGTNQTEKTKQDIWLENASTELTTIREQLGEFEGIIKMLLDGIGGLLATWIGGKIIGGVIGKGIGLLGGSGIGGSGAGLLASGGGVALGAFAGAAGIILTGLIADGIVKSKAANMDKNTQFYENQGAFDQYNKTDEEGNVVELSSAARDLISFGKDNAGTKGWGGNISDAFNFIGEYKSNPLMGWGVSRKDRNQATFEKEVNLLGAQNLSEIDTAKAILAWLMIADASGVIEDIDGWSSSKIKEAFPFIYNDDGDAKYWIDRIKSWGNFYNPQVSTDAGKTMTYWIPTDFSKYHRYGLDTVPYDDYPAILHEGEAVLTASTASELRNLLEEYRNTTKQSVQFDVVIQNQTTILVNKMDEIISAISNNAPMFTQTPQAEKARGILRNSMTRMISTSDFSQ